MFKIKKVKLYLILSMIFFSLVEIAGCSNSIDNKTSYIEKSHNFPAYFYDGQFNIVNNRTDLASLILKPIPKKYNDGFFKKKSLLVIFNIESSSKNSGAIKNYTISDKTLSVYIESKQLNENNDITTLWWYILELNNKEIANFENVKIYKDDKEFVSGAKPTTSKYYTSFSFSHSKVVKWPDFCGEEYDLSLEERRYEFILSFQKLDNIFSTSTGLNTQDYFSQNLFDENIVLCVARYEPSETDIKYYDFDVDGLKLSIEEEYIGGWATVLSKYLDFVVIPKSDIPNGELNLDLEYYWN